MEIIIALIVGFILGWLIEWVVDWLFWRRPKSGPGSYEDLNDRFMSLSDAHTHLQAKSVNTEHDNENLRVRLMNAKQDVANRDHEVDMFRSAALSNVEKTNAQVHAVEAERDEAKHQISALMTQVSSLEEAGKAENSKQQQADQEAARLRQAEQQAREQLVLVKGDRDKAKAAEAAVASERDALSAQLQQLQESPSNDDQVRQLNADIERLKARLAEERSQADQAKATAAQATELERQLAAKKAECDALQGQLDAAQQDTQDDQALHQQITDLKAALAKAQSECEQCEAALAKAEQAPVQISGLMGSAGDGEKTPDTSDTPEKPKATEQARPAGVAKPKNENDLKFVKGIGPKIEQLLHAAGIKTFVELSQTPVERIRDILHDAGERYQLAEPATWPEQAGLAAEGRWTDLHALQETIDRY